MNVDQELIDKLEDLSSLDVNPEFKLEVVRGVVRYDSSVHDDAAVSRMSKFLRAKISAAQLRTAEIGGRIVITQTTPWPGDSQADRLALIDVLHGLRLVK